MTSPPRSRMRPLVGSSKPAIMRSVVVLPQPDGPSIEKNSPSWISNETASTATTVVEALRHRLEDDRFGSCCAGVGRGQAATIRAQVRVRQRTPRAAASASAPASANAVASLASSATVPVSDGSDQRAEAPAHREQPHRDALPDPRALGAVGRERVRGREADRLRDPDGDHRGDERGRAERQRHRADRGREQERAEPDELEPVDPVGDARDRERRDRARDRDEREGRCRRRSATRPSRRGAASRASASSCPTIASTISATLALSSHESRATVRMLSRSGTCSCFGRDDLGLACRDGREHQHDARPSTPIAAFWPTRCTNGPPKSGPAIAPMGRARR